VANVGAGNRRKNISLRQQRRGGCSVSRCITRSGHVKAGKGEKNVREDSTKESQQGEEPNYLIQRKNMALLDWRKETGRSATMRN